MSCHVHRFLDSFNSVVCITAAVVPDDTNVLIIEAPECERLTGGTFDRFDKLKRVDATACIQLKSFGNWLFCKAPNLERIDLSRECEKHFTGWSFNPVIHNKINFR